MSWLWTPFILHLVLVIFCVILAESLCLFWVSCCGWTWCLWLAGAPAAHLLIGASSQELVFSSLAARALISLRSGIDGFTLRVTSSSLLEIYLVLSETYLYLSSLLLDSVTMPHTSLCSYYLICFFYNKIILTFPLPWFSPLGSPARTVTDNIQ